MNKVKVLAVLSMLFVTLAVLYYNEVQKRNTKLRLLDDIIYVSNLELNAEIKSIDERFEREMVRNTARTEDWNKNAILAHTVADACKRELEREFKSLNGTLSPKEWRRLEDMLFHYGRLFTELTWDRNERYHLPIPRTNEELPSAAGQWISFLEYKRAMVLSKSKLKSYYLQLLKKMEVDCLRYHYSNISSNGFNCGPSHVSALQFDSPIMREGDSVGINIYLGNYNSHLDPIISIGHERIRIEDGIGKYEIKNYKPGLHILNGQYNCFEVKGHPLFLSFRESYLVAPSKQYLIHKH